MKVLRYPLLLITFFLAIGIFAGTQLCPSPVVPAIMTPALAIAVVILWQRAKRDLLQKPYFAIAAWLLSMSVGLLTQSLHDPLNQNLHYTHIIPDDEVPVLKAVVSERLKSNAYSDKYYFDVLAANGKQATGRLLVSVPKDSLNHTLEAGETFIIADNLRPVPKALNPYQFDYAAYTEKQGVYHQAYLKDNYVRAGYTESFNAKIGRLRDKLVHSFDIHNFDSKTRNVINALLFGQRQDMDNETSDSYANAGVLHILAISGLHFAMLFYILSLILKPLGRFLRSGEVLQLILILALMWGFAFVTGLSASVVRSVAMFSFVMAGQFLNRNTNIYNSLAVSMLVLLIAKPMFLFDVGFQLSYAAVFAIVWLEPFYRKARVSRYKVINYGIDTMVISLAAQIGVLPLSLYYFHQFPLLFLLANIVVIPLSNVVLVTGLIVLLLNFIYPPLAILLGKVLGWLIEVMNSFIGWVASFESLVLKDIPFTLLLNISLYTVLIIGILWLYQKSFRRTAALLLSVVVFQLIFSFTTVASKSGNELIIFNNRETTLLAQKEQGEVTAFSNDSLAAENPVLRGYLKGSFAEYTRTKPLDAVLWHNGNRILIMDSTGVYKANMKPDILLLTHSPKINLERVLNDLKPKQVVADATNYKSYVGRWAATCTKAKIPFHATAEKGSYMLE